MALLCLLDSLRSRATFFCAISFNCMLRRGACSHVLGPLLSPVPFLALRATSLYYSNLQKSTTLPQSIQKNVAVAGVARV